MFYNFNNLICFFGRKKRNKINIHEPVLVRACFDIVSYSNLWVAHKGLRIPNSENVFSAAPIVYVETSVHDYVTQNGSDHGQNIEWKCVHPEKDFKAEKLSRKDRKFYQRHKGKKWNSEKHKIIFRDTDMTGECWMSFFIGKKRKSFDMKLCFSVNFHIISCRLKAPYDQKMYAMA